MTASTPTGVMAGASGQPDVGRPGDRRRDADVRRRRTRIEEHLRASGVPAIILRPSFYMGPLAFWGLAWALLRYAIFSEEVRERKGIGM